MKHRTNRRKFLAQVGAIGVAGAFAITPEAFAQSLVSTPEQTEGPYYPVTLPFDGGWQRDVVVDRELWISGCRGVAVAGSHRRLDLSDDVRSAFNHDRLKPLRDS